MASGLNYLPFDTPVIRYTRYNLFRIAIILLIIVLIGTNAVWGQTTQTFTTTGTFTVPPNVTQLIVECWGGGGAGGAATGNPAAGGGGAGGSYALKVINVVPGSIYTVTVGTGGTGGGGAGASGNASWFGTAATIYAQGGAGGGLANTNNSNGAGGTGSTSTSIGDITYMGGDGATGIYTSGTPGGAGGGGAGTTGEGNDAVTGTGGAAKANNGGAGANGVANSTVGTAGSTYGGGGSGGKANSNTDRNGGSGAAGLVLVTYMPSIVYTTSGNYAVPAGVTRIKVECWGGGGGGGSRTSNGRAGGGGGGAYASSIVTVIPFDAYPIVIGAGGVSAAVSTNGGASSFGTTTVVAAGGTTVPNNTTTGRPGGTVAASTGTIRYAGGNGADAGTSYTGGGGGGAGSTGAGGDAPAADANNGAAGSGSSNNGGSGGAGINGAANGNPGIIYGGGGGGSRRTNASGNVSGGTGSPGLVVITLPSNVTISSPNQVPTDSVYQGTTKWPVYSFQTTATISNALLTALSFTTAGTYIGTDITHFQLWYNTTNNISTATQIGSNITASLGAGSHTFSGLNQTTCVGSTGYFWVTADFTNTATADARLSVNAITSSDLTYELANISGSTTAAGDQIIVPVPRVTLADPGQVAAGNVNQGTVGHQLFRFTTAVTTANAVMTDLTFNTSGTYASTDVVNFKLWYNTSNNFTTAFQVGSPIIGSLGTGSHTFSDFKVTTYAGTTGYFWITADIASFPTAGRTIYVNNIGTGNLTYEHVFASGSTSNGGTQTIQTPNGVLLTSTFPAVSANSVLQGSTDQRIFKFNTIITGSAVTLQSVTFTTTGTYVAGDLLNFKLYYNTVNSMVGATQIGGTMTTALGPGAHTFNFSQGTAAGTTGYFWITTDIANAAVSGHTLSVSPLTTANLTYSGSPAKAGSTYAGGIQTIQLKVDSEGDGVADVNDLDDDNDGIPDYNENLYCNSTVAELFPNSNFDAGNTGFYTGYIYATGTNSLYPEGYYTVTPDASSVHDQFANCSAGHGNMMVVNGSPNANLIVWSSGTIAVEPYTDYTLTINLASVNPANPAQLIFNVNGENIGLQFNATTTNCQWVPGIATWNSGSNTTATFDIVNLNLVLGGNDFAIDDISCKYKLNCDTDGDKVPDLMDLDSDNDGIYDVVEAGGTATVNGTINGYTDADLDGLSDNVDNISSGSGGTDIFNGTPLPNPDTDGDGLNNLMDNESDGDGCYDVTEAGFSDPNGDGIPGNTPVTVNNTNGLVTSGTAYTTPADDNSDGIRDYVQVMPSITTQPVNRSICIATPVGTTFSVTATNTGGSYQWQVKIPSGTWTNISNGGVYSGALTATLTISSGVTTGYDGNMYRVILNNNAYKCTPAVTSDEVTLRVSNAVPTISGGITGDAVVCPNASGLNYSVAAVASATAYTWTVPAGWTITSGQNTRTITASSAAAGGNVTVTASNACGSGAAVSLAVTINTPSPTFTAPVSATACQSADVTYTTQAAKTNYIWTIPGTEGADYTITSGGTSTDNNLVLKWLTTGGKTVTVNYTSGGCQAAVAGSNTITVNANAIINSHPANPAAICAGAGTATMSVTASGTISGYQWQYLNGAVWTNLANNGTYSGVTTTTLTITNPVAGLNGTQFRCAVTGTCGNVTSNSATLTVNAIPSVPGIITGTSTQCPSQTGQTYSIAAVTGATSYTWSVPTGWSVTAGTGTTAITVTTGSAGQNGDITVTASNGCGTSSASTLPVTVDPGTPAVPGVITGTASQCPSLTGQTYSVSAVSGASTYTWTVPAGWTITGGTGTTAITVTTGTAGQDGNITVTAGNSCGTSAARSLAVTVNQRPSIANKATSVYSGVAFTVSPVNGTDVVPAGTTYSWPLPTVTGGLTGGATGSGAASISGTLNNPLNSAQTATYTVTPSAAGCTGSDFTVTVTINAIPDITNMTATVCSGTGFTATPVDGTNGIVPPGTTYSWNAPTVTGGLTGGAAGSGAGSVSGTLSNPTNGVQTATYTITPQVGTYTGGTFTVTVTVNPVPSVTISGETIVCEETVLTLDAGTGFSTYEWKAGATVLGTNHDLTITTGTVNTDTPVTESYSVTVTNAYGCESVDSHDISVFHKPETGPDYYIPNTIYR